ncbi:MAG: hypothetical protein ACKN9T_19750 [Candidatus Methylumidiphilus sp.]
MAHFVIEINISPAMQAVADHNIAEIGKLIETAGGKLIDSNVNSHVQTLSLIVEAKTEYIIVDLLEDNMFDIGQIRRVFLLEIYRDVDEEDRTSPPNFAGFFAGMDLRKTVAIEIYAH